MMIWTGCFMVICFCGGLITGLEIGRRPVTDINDCLDDLDEAERDIALKGRAIAQLQQTNKDRVFVVEQQSKRIAELEAALEQGVTLSIFNHGARGAKEAGT